MTEMTVTTDNQNNLLTYTYDTDNLAEVSVTTFSSMDGSVQYNTLTRGSFLSLNNVFNPEDTNAQVYGDGTHANPEKVLKKIDLWGARGDNQGPLRAFLIQEGDAEKIIFSDRDTLGFVNLGVSGMKDVNGNPIYEGGALFSSSNNGSPVVTTAMDAVYGDYLPSLHKDGILPGRLFIYTVSTENPLYGSLQATNSLVELGSAFELNGNGAYSDKSEYDQQYGSCISAILATSPRFAGTEGSSVMDSGVLKAVFYNLLDESLCQKAGEAPADTTPEL